MTPRRVACWACAMAVLSAALAASAAQRVELTIDTGGLKWAGEYPTSGGIPFAKGQLKDPAAARLLVGGREVPAQTKALATWPDGSVKWLLVSFVAPADAQLVLEYGEGVKAATIEKPLKLDASGQAVTVDTGFAKFTVNKDGGGFIDELFLDANGDGKYGDDEKMVASGRSNFMDFVHLGKPGDYPVLSRTITGEIDPSKVQIDELRADEAGPVRAVVLIRGRYRVSKLGSTIPEVKGKGACPFTLRLTAYRGTGIVQVEHFFVYEGDPDYDFLREAGLGVTARLDPKTAKVVCATAAGAHEVNLAQTPIFGLYQNNPDAFRAYKAPDEQTPDQTVVQDKRFEGVVDVSDARWGVGVSHRRTWQNWANGIGADGRDGRVTAYFWPPEANVLDFRRYAREWGVGETGAGGSHDIRQYSRFAAKGVGKTHSMMFHFHKATADARDLLHTALLFDRTALLKCDAQRYADTQVLGIYRPADPRNFPEYEKYITNTLDLMIDSQQEYRWYGFFNFGAVQSRYNSVHRLGRWDSDFGRWGWGGNDGVGRANHAYMLQYLRSGDRRYFEFGEACCLVNYDTWMVHTKEYFWDFGGPRDLSGNCHRHNVQPFGCPFVGARGSYPVGMKIYYYLTGSGRAADGLDEVLATGVDFLNDPTMQFRLGHCAEEDGYGTTAQSLLCAWERTGDKKYVQLMRKLFTEPQYTQCFTPKDPFAASMTTAFGLCQGVVEYFDLSGDKEVIGNILTMARHCNVPAVESNYTYPSAYLRIFSDAVRLSGTDEFNAICEKAIQKKLEAIKSAGVMTVSRDQWPAPLGAPEPNFDFNAIRDLPYLMQAIQSAKASAGRKEE